LQNKIGGIKNDLRVKEVSMAPVSLEVVLARRAVAWLNSPADATAAYSHMVSAALRLSLADNNGELLKAVIAYDSGNTMETEAIGRFARIVLNSAQ